MRPVPVGAGGELYLGGSGVARGYLNRPAADRRDVSSPIRSHRARGAALPHRRPGALAARRQLEFLGRIDHQVKLRGFRIELGEIETALANHPEVGEAVVIVREDTPGDQRLVAYMVAMPQMRLDTTIVKAKLRDQLPEFMIPSAFMILDCMPLTPNGKTDRSKLPKPDYAGTGALFVSPRSPIEEALALIWADVLGIPKIGIHDDLKNWVAIHFSRLNSWPESGILWMLNYHS